MEQNSELYKDLDRVLITKDEIAAKHPSVDTVD